MASAWGASLGRAFGASWGALSTPVDTAPVLVGGLVKQRVYAPPGPRKKFTQEDEDELRRYLRLVEKNAQESAEIKAKALAVPAKQVSRQEARTLTNPVLTLVSKPEHQEPFVKMEDPDKEKVAHEAINEEAMLIMVMMTEL